MRGIAIESHGEILLLVEATSRLSMDGQVLQSTYCLLKDGQVLQTFCCKMFMPRHISINKMIQLQLRAAWPEVKNVDIFVLVVPITD